ncbi:MAG: hypothetical protein ABJB22_01760, partial [Verrucomicrobiota bacterium]
MNHFLQLLKPYYDAGFIHAVGVLAILAVVVVALLPHFLRWSRRPRLRIAIPGNYHAPRQEFSNEQIGVYTLSAPFILRNAGRSIASNVRAVATDFYKFLPSPKALCEHVRSSQHALEGSEIDLLAGFSTPVLLCSFTSAGLFKSGFVVGRSIKCSFSFPSANNPKVPAGGVKFNPPPDLDPGTYVVRVVISGSNVLPTSNLILMELGGETNPELGEEIKLGLAGRRER